MLWVCFACLVCIACSALVPVNTLSSYKWDGVHGNSLEQFERYVNVTAELGFPHEAFMEATRRCFEIAMARNTTWFPCIRSVVAKLARGADKNPNLRIWTPKLMPGGSNFAEAAWRIQDCMYRIDTSSASMATHANGVPFFTFAIDQSNCDSTLEGQKTPEGGAALEVIGHSDGEVIGCSVLDLFSSRYRVNCALPGHAYHSVQTHRTGATAKPFCLALTIILDYEHFGAYHDFLLRLLRTPGLRSIIYDHFSLCADPLPPARVGTGRGGSIAVLANVPLVDKFDKIVTFSGHWVKTPQSHTRHAWPPVPPGFGDVQAERANSSHTDRPVLLWKALGQAPPTETSFVLQALLWEPARQVVVSHPGPLATPRGQPAPTEDTRLYEGSAAFRGDVHSAYTSSSQLTMIGCSHVRYLFNLFAREAGLSLPHNRKHGHATLGNLRYIEEYLAQYQAMRVETFCREAQVEAETPTRGLRRHVLVLQPGAWDSDNQSPRMILHNNQSAAALLGVVGRVLSGALPCGGLAQVVWLTAMPFPLCIDDPQTCNLVRNHRSNGAIRAVDEFFLKGLRAMRPMQPGGGGHMHAGGGIVLSIVDAFSIIYPRLLFPEHEEVVCAVHYMCRLDNGRLFVTPGAAAYVTATKAALRWGAS